MSVSVTLPVDESLNVFVLTVIGVKLRFLTKKSTCFTFLQYCTLCKRHISTVICPSLWLCKPSDLVSVGSFVVVFIQPEKKEKYHQMQMMFLEIE